MLSNVIGNVSFIWRWYRNDTHLTGGKQAANNLTDAPLTRVLTTPETDAVRQRRGQQYIHKVHIHYTPLT